MDDKIPRAKTQDHVPEVQPFTTMWAAEQVAPGRTPGIDPSDHFGA